ncbi:MAG: hypothetical protein ACI4RI_03515, partial [Ruminococcus sp.]
FCLGYKTGTKLNDRVIDMYKNKKEYCKQLEKHIDKQCEIIEKAGKLINEYQKTNNKLFEQLKRKDESSWQEKQEALQEVSHTEG